MAKFLISLIIVLLIFLQSQSKADFINARDTTPKEKIEASSLTVDSSEKRPERIIIERIKIDLPIKPARIVDGYWEVFEDSASWGIGSGTLGTEGNIVVFAHNRPGLCYSHKDVEIGETVELHSGDIKLFYEVVEKQEVEPSNLDVVQPTEDETLTIYTCARDDTKRHIVVAKRSIK